jgi:hypothetical protein
LIKSLNVSRRRRIPFFFRTDLEISAELAISGKVRDIFRSACLILGNELPGLGVTPLHEIAGTILTNLRGRPEPMSESREETLLLFEGNRTVNDDGDETKVPFSLVVTTRFLDFSGKDIRYEVRYHVPPHLEWESRSLSEIFSFPEVEPLKLTLFIERFVPRAFTFLGNKLPELKETFSVSVHCNKGVELSIRDLDYDRELGLTLNTQHFIEATGQLGSDSGLEKAIGDSIAAISSRK